MPGSFSVSRGYKCPQMQFRPLVCFPGLYLIFVQRNVDAGVRWGLPRRGKCRVAKVSNGWTTCFSSGRRELIAGVGLLPSWEGSFQKWSGWVIVVEKVAYAGK